MKENNSKKSKISSIIQGGVVALALSLGLAPQQTADVSLAHSKPAVSRAVSATAVMQRKNLTTPEMGKFIENKIKDIVENGLDVSKDSPMSLKVAAAVAWVAMNSEYDTTVSDLRKNLDKDTTNTADLELSEAYTLLTTHKSVCLGDATVTHLLLEELGVENHLMIIEDNSKEKVGHAAVLAKMDGKQMVLDPTALRSDPQKGYFAYEPIVYFRKLVKDHPERDTVLFVPSLKPFLQMAKIGMPMPECHGVKSRIIGAEKVKEKE